MLAWLIAAVLGFIGLFVALVAGEVRYSDPKHYPLNQKFSFAVAIVMVALALTTARYL